MLYLLDASVLITAHNSYYPVDGVPEYWEWLAYMGEQGRVKMPFEIFDEVKDGRTPPTRICSLHGCKRTPTRKHCC